MRHIPALAVSFVAAFMPATSRAEQLSLGEPLSKRTLTDDEKKEFCPRDWHFRLIEADKDSAGFEIIDCHGNARTRYNPEKSCDVAQLHFSFNLGMQDNHLLGTQAILDPKTLAGDICYSFQMVQKHCPPAVKKMILQFRDKPEANKDGTITFKPRFICSENTI